MSGCCVVEFERTCLLLRRDDRFHVGHAGVAQFKCMSVENLLERMVLRKAFVDDVQELSTKVSSYV